MARIGLNPEQILKAQRIVLTNLRLGLTLNESCEKARVSVAMVHNWRNNDPVRQLGQPTFGQKFNEADRDRQQLHRQSGVTVRGCPLSITITIPA